MSKKAFIIGLAITTCAIWVLAQSNNYMQSDIGWHSMDTTRSNPLTHPYEPTNPPLLTLPEAYSLALTRLGTDTNQYYCVSASCLNPLPDSTPGGMHGKQGWLFLFDSADSHQRQVLVYFDKGTWAERPTGINGPSSQF